MKIKERVFTLATGFIIALSFLLIGSRLHLERSGITLAVVSICIGGVMLIVFIQTLIDGELKSDTSDVYHVLVITSCFMFAFGVIAEPVWNDIGIMAWASWWDILLILGLFPTIVVAKDIAAEIILLARLSKSQEDE